MEDQVTEDAPDLDAIRKQEQQRITAIDDLAKRFDLPAEMRIQLITDNVPLEAARSQILDHLAETADRTPN